MGAADADGVEPARAVAGDPDVLGDLIHHPSRWRAAGREIGGVATIR